MKDRDDIPVMLLGLKRDLREEKPGVIYPQEVSLSFLKKNSHCKASIV